MRLNLKVEGWHIPCILYTILSLSLDVIDASLEVY